MNKKGFWLSIVAVVISFAGGFMLANALNRKELDDLQGEVGRLKNSEAMVSTENDSATATLSDEEIRQKIAQADQNPENIEFQKNLAIALYGYANAKQDTNLLPEVARLLERVYRKNPRDYNAIISLGQIYFDIGRIKKDPQAVEKSRKFYQKAAAIKPSDAEVKIDLGATYLLSNPPENEKAIGEFQKSLTLNPKSERALENMIRALINAGKMSQASDYLKRLKQVNSKNEAVPEFEAQLSPHATNKQ